MLPHIGTVKLQELSALGLERVFNHLKDAGGKNRKTKKSRPLSAKTVRHIAGVMHVALGTAVRWKLLKVNPIDAVVLPKVKKREARALDAAQLAWYADAARDASLYEFLMVAAGTGCRRGELLALTWPDVNFFGRVLWVSKSLEQTRAGLRVKRTKNEKPRPIELAQSTVDILKGLQASQENNRKFYGPDYRADLNLIFCALDGDYLKPDSVTAKACLLAKKAGLKDTSIHTLRHSHGSQLLSDGIPLPVVSKRLGHSDVNTTARIYSHVLACDERRAADAWEKSVPAVIERDRKNAKIS